MPISCERAPSRQRMTSSSFASTALDQKDHQESDDRCGCVDDKLPGVGKAKYRTRTGPYEYEPQSNAERIGCPCQFSDGLGETSEELFHGNCSSRIVEADTALH